MDLHYLQNFLVVVEQGSISNAAALIGISQPALTRQVQALEAQVDAALLERGRRGVMLTPAGEALAFEARQIVARVREAQVAVDAAIGKCGGRFALGTSLSLARLLLPHLAMSVRTSMPDVRLSVMEGYSDDLFERVLDGRLDLAVADYRTPVPKLEMKPLFTEPIVAAGGPGVFGNNAKITMREFLGQDVVLAASTGRLRLMYERLAAKMKRPAGSLLEIDSPAALSDLIANGGGVSLLPYSSVMHQVAAGRMSMAEFSPTPLRRQVAFVFAKSRPMTVVLENIEKVTRAFVSENAANLRWSIPAEQKQMETIEE